MNMTAKLFFQALTKFLIGLILVALLIFVPARTLDFFNGWLFMIILFVPMLTAGIVMIFRRVSEYITVVTPYIRGYNSERPCAVFEYLYRTSVFAFAFDGEIVRTDHEIDVNHRLVQTEFAAFLERHILEAFHCVRIAVSHR